MMNLLFEERVQTSSLSSNSKPILFLEVIRKFDCGFDNTFNKIVNVQ